MDFSLIGSKQFLKESLSQILQAESDSKHLIWKHYRFECDSMSQDKNITQPQKWQTTHS